MLVLLGLRLSAARSTIQTIPTPTFVQFQYIGTEPVIAQPTDTPPTEVSVTVSPTEIFLSPPPRATIPTVTEATSIVFLSNTPVTRTATTQPLGVTYDDVDPRFIYTGNWIAQSDVNGTYRNTLHISSTIGDAVQLLFFGQLIRVTYQSGPSLGTVAIKLDSNEYVVNQNVAETGYDEWESPVLPLVNHTLTITHISGGSVNIDSALIIDINTPTPTATPTPTQ